jgi:peptidoglycan hydrolase-like protein with peptidoglycan-binding domain
VAQARRRSVRKRQARGAGFVLVAVGVGLAAIACGALVASGRVGDLLASSATTAAPTTLPPTTLAPTTTTTLPPTTTTAVAPTTTTAPDGSLRSGATGPEVDKLQARLVELGYWLGKPGGGYGALTRQAVMAFQKAEGLSRDGTAGPTTLAKLATASRPKAHSTTGNLVEVDLDRQLLLVVRDGKVLWAFNTSTGSGEKYKSSAGAKVARTPIGHFTFQHQIDGVRHAELGDLYRPKYFKGGVAVHGSGSIPAHPASHGCVRLTNSAMNVIWSEGYAPLGSAVWVY